MSTRSSCALAAALCALAAAVLPAQHPAPRADSVSHADRRRPAGASVATADSLDASARDARSFSELLTARFPGVSAQRTSGASGAGTLVRIRGLASPLGPNEPMLVVDGVRLNARQVSFDVPGFTVAPSRLDDLNIADVDRVEVLRGPAAAALYGAGTTNGVIVVTTRRGSPRAPLRLHGYAEGGAVQQAADFPTNYQLFGRIQGGQTTGICTLALVTGGICSVEEVRTYEPFAGSDAFRTGGHAAAGASAEGGLGPASYFVSGRYDGENGAVNPNSTGHARARANVTVQPRRGLELALTSSYVDGRTRMPYDVALLRTALLAHSPSEPVAPPTPNVAVVQDVSRASGGVSARWSGTSWLSATARYGRDRLDRDDGESVVRPSDNPLSVSLQRFSGDAKLTTLGGDLAAVFHAWRGIALHTLAGYERIAEERHESFRQEFVGSTDPSAVELSKRRLENTNATLFLQQRLAFGGRVDAGAGLVRSTVEHSMVKRLPARVHPTADVAVRVTSGLTLRAAHGAAGDARALDSLPTNLVLGTDYDIGGGSQPGGRPPLKPERTSETEFGADADFAGGRARVELTRYRKVTSRAIVQQPYSPNAGGGFLVRNSARVRNSGVEALVRARILEGRRLQWDAELSVATNDNVVLAMETLPYTIGTNLFAQAIFPGRPLAGFLAHPYSYADANGDRLISTSEVTVGEAVYAGAPTPRREAALRTSVTVARSISAFAVLDYRGGQHVLNVTRRTRCGRVAPTCREALDPSAPLDRLAEVAASLDGRTLAPFVEDASYLKLRALGVTAELSRHLAGFVGGRSLRVTLLGQNLATRTDYRGQDPEVRSVAGSTLLQADAFTQPLVRTVSLRLAASW